MPAEFEVTEAHIRAVLAQLPTARGRTEWMQRVLATDHFHLLEHGVHVTEAMSAERDLLIALDKTMVADLREPSEDLVYALTRLCEDKPAPVLPPGSPRRFAEALLGLWDAEGGECAHGVGIHRDCDGERCETCNGSGKVGMIDPPHECPTCEGEGQRRCHWQEFRPAMREALAYLAGPRPNATGREIDEAGEMSVRLRNILLNVGWYDRPFVEVSEKQPSELLALRSFGRKCLAEVRMLARDYCGVT
jgi:hypothetical protein